MDKKEKHKLYMREYYRKNPEKNRQHVRKWREKNPHRSHGKRVQRTTEYREAIFYYLIDRDGLLCGVCRKEFGSGRIEIDHVVPVRLGGTHRMNNLRLVHSTCNQRNAIEVRKTLYGH